MSRFQRLEIWFVLWSALAACGHARPGLGTSWGEAIDSKTKLRSFVRASDAPWAELVLHYDDPSGVIAHAAYLDAAPDPEAIVDNGALGVEVTDADGEPLPGFAAGDRHLVMGKDGERYKIVIHNHTPARYEVVASVDGLDVIDGLPASPERRGYLVGPHGDLSIDGFRTSNDTVAAFRFGRVADSYAAQTTGDRNVGVIGVAIFTERHDEELEEAGRREAADPFPARDFAAPPREDR